LRCDFSLIAGLATIGVLLFASVTATGMLPSELPKREGIITTSFAVVALSVVQGLTMGPPSRPNL
jgi:hypothetical protein